MDWYSEARTIFDDPRPVRFTGCSCLECRDIDEVLSSSDPDSIQMNAFRDPATLRLTNVEGQKYYLPAFVRFILDDVPGEPLAQFLDVLGCTRSSRQRLIEALERAQLQFTERFLLHLMESRPDEIEIGGVADDLLDCLSCVKNRLE